MPDIVPEEILRNPPVPYKGSLISLFRLLQDFIPKNAGFVEQNENYQMQIIKLLHTVKLGGKSRRKTEMKRNANGRKEQDGAADGSTHSSAQENILRERFAHVFMELLKLKLSRAVHVKILLHIHDRIIPNLSRPLFLADYLVTIFSKGGLLSVLALNGLFTLIQTHHLDFPQFYERFYMLLTSQILESKYRARFFHLADLFMGSSHIPAYTVAAVAKRLSRLSLTAPTESLPLLLIFTMNLLIRHSSLIIMLHNPDDANDIRSDPYVMNETDMQKCRALQSSLWELKTLKEHYNMQVRKLAEHLDHPLPETEFDINGYLELDCEEMVDIIREDEKAKESSLGESDRKLKANSNVFALFPTNGLCANVFVI
ncbi:nucleolar complex protein 4 homolog [Paramacrobiotus metropolitanus]|uniref:nucleolar complex protein 4 homolog n=1 Tax=Paramacrobiotus metropolitanus TaxID=2943436 RepID=UPI002445D8F7|nr:nucleolar complex protein 4 homolog [Paramacrobiotus metropolitanus]XP_055327766.1 nucleolar complex protein 4 homolog [Paramacrobiotus metropolitanus]XP_055327767.1 nucleolar complex protein 4 homolog [Paramacrobiotus metropolitanus]